MVAVGGSYLIGSIRRDDQVRRCGWKTSWMKKMALTHDQIGKWFILIRVIIARVALILEKAIVELIYCGDDFVLNHVTAISGNVR